MRIRQAVPGVLLATLASVAVSVMSGGSAHAAGPLDNDAVHIINQGSGQCLDVRDQNTSPGAKLQQVECKDIDGQRFKFVPAGDGTYNIVAKNTGLCADVTYGGTEDWVPIQMYYCNGAGNQRFSLVDVTSGPVAYHALEPAHVSGFCLRVDPRGPQTRTASILQFHCNGDAAEHWRWS